MFGISKLEAYGIVGFVLLVACLAAGGWCYHLGGNAADARWEVKQAKATAIDLKTLQDAVQQNIALTQGALGRIDGIKATHTTVKGVIEREILTNPIYSNDCLPDTGVVQWNSISAGRTVLPSSTTRQPSNSSGAELPKGNVAPDHRPSSGNPLKKP